MCFNNLVGAGVGLATRDTHNEQVQYEATQQYYDAEMDEWAGDKAKTAAQEEADIILRNAQSVRGTQVSQQAASGISITSGSAEAVRDRTASLAMQDALAAIYSGVEKREAYRTRAGQRRVAADKFVKSNYLSMYEALVYGFTSGGSLNIQDFKRSQPQSNTLDEGSTGVARGGGVNQTQTGGTRSAGTATRSGYDFSGGTDYGPEYGSYF